MKNKKDKKNEIRPWVTLSFPDVLVSSLFSSPGFLSSCTSCLLHVHHPDGDADGGMRKECQYVLFPSSIVSCEETGKRKEGLSKRCVCSMSYIVYPFCHLHQHLSYTYSKHPYSCPLHVHDPLPFPATHITTTLPSTLPRFHSHVQLPRPRSHFPSFTSIKTSAPPSGRASHLPPCSSWFLFLNSTSREVSFRFWRVFLSPGKTKRVFSSHRGQQSKGRGYRCIVSRWEM